MAKERSKAGTKGARAGKGVQVNQGKRARKGKGKACSARHGEGGREKHKVLAGKAKGTRGGRQRGVVVEKGSNPRQAKAGGKGR